MFVSNMAANRAAYSCAYLLLHLSYVRYRSRGGNFSQNLQTLVAIIKFR